MCAASFCVQASSERMEAWTEQMKGLGYAGAWAKDLREGQRIRCPDHIRLRLGQVG